MVGVSVIYSGVTKVSAWNRKMHKTASYYPQETDNTAGEADVHKHRGLYVNTGAITAILQMWLQSWYNRKVCLLGR